ncbi:MAG: amidohydrolase family protein [Gemmatimonadetes bacterium]|nr:amidohydrolase family protein [Gemmatimonadota bacterium]
MRSIPTLLLASLAVTTAWAQGSNPAASRATHTVAGAASGRIAFVHAEVIPMDRERVLHDYTVVVDGGTITAVGPSASVRVPAGVERVDARGRYLMPALADMHVHLLDDAWKMMLTPEAKAASAVIPDEAFLLPYLANGVTAVQVLSANAYDLALRERIRRGEVLGPRMILAPMVDGPDRAWPPPISTWVATPAAAAAAVRRMKAEGYDKIKAYSFLSREQYDSIVVAAREQHMDVIGHVPYALSVEEVVAAGQRYISHSEEIAKHAATYDSATIDRYATLLVKNGVWMSPTLVTTHAFLDLFDDPGSVGRRPEAEYFRHPMQAGVWGFLLDSLYLKIPASGRRSIRDGYEQFQLAFTRVFARKGGKLLAGSDTPLPGLVPGFALHRELRELVNVGLTPYQALQSATTGPAEYLGERDRRGIVATGQATDLVLLTANPLADIAAASTVDGLLMRGQWLPGEELRRRMRATVASARTP